MDETVVAVDIDEVERIGVGHVLVVVGRVYFVRDEEFSLADWVGVCVEVPLLTIAVVNITSVVQS